MNDQHCWMVPLAVTLYMGDKWAQEGHFRGIDLPKWGLKRGCFGVVFANKKGGEEQSPGGLAFLFLSSLPNRAGGITTDIVRQPDDNT